MRIEVDTAEHPHAAFASDSAKCGSHRADLNAIGNEAMIRDHKGKNHQTTERVVGRVRDQIFLLDVSSSEHHADRNALREKDRNVSEQVAEILY